MKASPKPIHMLALHKVAAEEEEQEEGEKVEGEGHPVQHLLQLQEVLQEMLQQQQLFWEGKEEVMKITSCGRGDI